MGETIREKHKKLTENLICNSFLTLLKEEDINSITVADVCRQANISRPTFYLHFCDINDLIDYINRWYVDAITPLICMTYESEHLSRTQGLEILTEIMDILRSWPEYSMVILGLEKGQKVINDVTELVRGKYMEHTQTYKADQAQAAMYRFAFSFYGGWGVFREWCRGGLKESPEELLEYIHSLS